MNWLVKVKSNIQEIYLFCLFLWEHFRLEFAQWKLNRTFAAQQKKIGNALTPSLKAWSDEAHKKLIEFEAEEKERFRKKMEKEQAK